ncbi:MAG: hypothetical protein QW423_01490 [Candidatus Aenigmatarchaeota archaeon]
MVLTLNDLMPISLCIVTQELLDTKRFRNNFCDFTIFKYKDLKFIGKIIETKRQLNSFSLEKNFLEGHKTIILSNIDKIISLVVSRYVNLDSRVVEKIVEDCKDIMGKILDVENFGQLASLEPEFRSKITLKVYELFAISSKTR